MNHLKQKLFAKKEKPGMEQDINDKSEKVKGELKQKSKVVLKLLLIITYIMLVIYFVFKPLMEFMLMVELNFKLSILKYLN